MESRDRDCGKEEHRTSACAIFMFMFMFMFMVVFQVKLVLELEGTCRGSFLGGVNASNRRNPAMQQYALVKQ
jgi:hypothetical protein